MRMCAKGLRSRDKLPPKCLIRRALGQLKALVLPLAALYYGCMACKDGVLTDHSLSVKSEGLEISIFTQIIYIINRGHPV